MAIACRLGAVVWLLMCTAVTAEPCCDPEGPFARGESFPDKPATCTTAADWIDRAPDTDERISFAITGALTAVHWDGALAYLIMCQAPNVEVMCVTYSAKDHAVGEPVTFAGGYMRAGERRIMLDPCLPHEAE